MTSSSCPMGIQDCNGTEKHGFRMDKSISLQGILTALLVLGAFFAAYARQESRIALLEQGMAQVHEKNKEQDKQWQESLRAINDKLDRLIERELGKH